MKAIGANLAWSRGRPGHPVKRFSLLALPANAANLDDMNTHLPEFNGRY